MSGKQKMNKLQWQFDLIIAMDRTKFTNLDSLSLQGIDEDAELIPLMTPEDEEEINILQLEFDPYKLIDKKAISNLFNSSHYT